MNSSKMTLKEVMNVNLQGYQLQNAYFLELSHSLMGFFPAIIPSLDDRIVICTDLEVLRAVEEMLPKKRRQLGKLLMLVNHHENIGFNLTNLKDENDTPFTLLSREKFEQLKNGKDEPFKWKFGLIGGNNNYDQSVIHLP